MTGLDWALRLLVCPRCRLSLELVSGGDVDGVLAHRARACDERYPLMGGIPRLLMGAHRAQLVGNRRAWFDADRDRRSLAERWLRTTAAAADSPIVQGFDFEWAHFSAVGTSELRRVAGQYFDQVPDALFAADNIVLDAGCGAGRWAYEMAMRGPRVIAMDLGLSIEIAKRNTSANGRVVCVQADLGDLPLRDGAISWAYSLGVVHHIVDTTHALRRLARSVRPGGSVVVYVYYALDERGVAYRSLYRASDVLRRLISRFPRSLAYGVATGIAVAVYFPLARTSALAHRLGLFRLSQALPLSFYRDLSFEVMRNDSLDRFGTRLEKRYTREELVELMRQAGLRDIQVSAGPPYWHAIGIAGAGPTE